MLKSSTVENGTDTYLYKSMVGKKLYRKKEEEIVRLRRVR